MTKSINAALLSALVIPGAGHIYLKHYFTGAALICTAGISFYYLITEAIAKALLITEKIQSGEVPLDAEIITDLVLKQASASEAQVHSLVSVVLVICWTIGILHSYITGRALDKKIDKSHNN